MARIKPTPERKPKEEKERKKTPFQARKSHLRQFS